jgi:hypothetical protein
MFSTVEATPYAALWIVFSDQLRAGMHTLTKVIDKTLASRT